MLVFRSYDPSLFESACAVFRSNMPTYFLEHELLMFKDFLNEPGTYFAGFLNERLIALGGYRLNTNDEVALCWGMVHRDYHHQGYGKALLDYRMGMITKDFSGKKIVHVTSQHTVDFFTKNGFRLISVKKDGFGEGLDECKMEFNT